MGRPPAVVIVARHGARLDQADKQWINTSATPYDPPLTYGGWTQSRALGARIASIIKARESSLGSSTAEDQGDNVSTLTSPPVVAAGLNGKGMADHQAPLQKPAKRPSRHRIVIHTSPFLRCVQTSIAISAGMSQWHALAPPAGNSHRSRNFQPHAGASRLHSAGPLTSPLLEAIPEPGESLQSLSIGNSVPENRKYQKVAMRIDAFLGEWLAPDYFELISQPPDSKLMVAGAKAELLRPGDYSTMPGSSINPSTPNIQGFPGGWGTPPTAPLSKKSSVENSLSSLSIIGDASPRRDRASSHGSAGSPSDRIIKPSPRLASSVRTEPEGYVPPTPTYAVSPADPIPAGYVAHARDVCVQVDYQWDSMRPPQWWGDGGEYGEEWAAMHKRFRKGLQQMIDWYKKHDTSDTSIKGETPSKSDDVHGHNLDAENEDDVETVLILVTHGAGCNALLGALTDSPVLMDIGMASLTMAIRKDVKNNTQTTNGHELHVLDGRSSISTGISEEYEVKLSASTEHLRAGSNPLSVPQLQSRGVTSPQIYGSNRHRLGSGTANSMELPFSIGEPHRSAVSTGIGSIRRVANSSSPFPRSMSTSVTPNGLTGLWSPQIDASTAESGEPGDDMVLNFGDDSSDDSKTNESPVESFSTVEPAADEKKEPETTDVHTPDVAVPPPSTNGNIVEAVKPQYQGLWGTAIAVRDLGSQKDKLYTPKRRWTVDEHKSRS